MKYKLKQIPSICEAGKCPYCESENVEYYGLILDDDGVYFPMTCNDCRKKSKESYRLEYIDTVGDEV